MCSSGWIRKHRAARMYIVVLSSEYFPYLLVIHGTIIHRKWDAFQELTGLYGFLSQNPCSNRSIPVDVIENVTFYSTSMIEKYYTAKKPIIRGLTVIYIFCTLFYLFFVSTQKKLLSSRYKPSFWLFGKFGKSGQKPLHTRASIPWDRPAMCWIPSQIQLDP